MGTSYLTRTEASYSYGEKWCRPSAFACDSYATRYLIRTEAQTFV